MKKILSLITATIMMISLVACGTTQTTNQANIQNENLANNQTENQESNETQNQSNDQESTQNEETDVTEEKVLVSYYSYSGNTQKAAEQIAELTGADLNRIDREEAYGEDFRDVAEAEILEGSRPSITVEIEDISSYDTIFIGYPIWYKEAPAMIATYLENNNFDGKRIIPFCTSGSDEIDSSLHIFEELCPNAVMEAGYTANDLNGLSQWIEGLNLSTELASENATSKEEHILIAYFSVPEDLDTNGVDAIAGASIVVDDEDIVGNTQYVAQIIQTTIGGDLFRIETTKQYPLDHDELVDYAADEQDNNMRPELASQIDNLDQYDTIILGFPNWWADLPMPLYTFLEQYDFSGKTIIPFVTHGGSGFSNTRNTIAELQPNAIMSENTLSLSRNDVAGSREQIIEWANSLGL